MPGKELVGRCGLYCGACSIYIAERFSPSMRERIAAGAKCLPEQVRCNGCGALTPECWGNGCKIVICTNERGHGSCHECEEFTSDTCEKFGRISKGYLEEGVDLKDNLRRISSGATDVWLDENRKRFTCPSCGAALTVHNDECPQCQVKWR